MSTTPHTSVVDPSWAAAVGTGEVVVDWPLEDLLAWHDAGEAAAWEQLLASSAPAAGALGPDAVELGPDAVGFGPDAVGFGPDAVVLGPAMDVTHHCAHGADCLTCAGMVLSAGDGQATAPRADSPDVVGIAQCAACAGPGADRTVGSGLGSVAGELAGMLARLRELSLDGLSAGELVEVISAVEGLRGGVAAVQARATMAFETAMVEEGVAKGWTTRGARRGIGPAVALARGVSPSVGDRWLAFCRRLAHLPATFEALALGVCSEEAALVVAVETGSVGAGLAGVVDVEMAPVLGTCGTRSLTEQARVLVDTLDPEAAAARCRAAVADRHVVTRVGRDGMGSITVHAPLPQVAAAAEALAVHTTRVCASRKAGESGGGGRVPSCGSGGMGSESASGKVSEPGSGGQEGEELSWAQVQADVAITWLSGSLPAAPPPVTVNLVMTPTQLLGADASPVRVPGYGHIPATLARTLITPTHPVGTADPSSSMDETGVDGASPREGDRRRKGHGTRNGDGTRVGDGKREGLEHRPRAGQRTGRGYGPGHGDGSSADVTASAGDAAAETVGKRAGAQAGSGLAGAGAAGDGSIADVTASTWDEILAPLLTAPFPGCEPPADAAVFLRRLFTTPDGRDLASMESTARLFPPHLRQFFVLRDDRDRHPYSDAPIRHADHVTSHSEGGPTSVRNGQGLSVRANHVKTLPGWKAKTLTEDEVTAYAKTTDATDPNGRIARLAGPYSHVVELTTPTGHTYLSTPRPLTG